MHAAITAATDAVTVVAVGPLTNVASLLHQHPEVAERIAEVIAVAGRRPLQRFTTGSASHPDLNFEKDPEAFAAILSTAVQLTLAPFELSSQLAATRWCYWYLCAQRWGTVASTMARSVWC
jgi:inosine-uridine nucleoside N-ribohydrolase